MSLAKEVGVPSTKMKFAAVAADMMINRHVDLQALHEANGIEITDNVVKEICKANTSIKTLKLDSCIALTDFSLVDIGRYCKSLEHISLSGCVKVKLVGLRSLAMNCRCLRSMNFEGYDIDDSGLRIIASSLNKLEILNLTNCDSITDRGLSQIAHCCTNLKTLKLGGCYKIGEAGIWAFNELENCPYMEEIELFRCKYVSNSALLSVAKRCPRLKKIDISECSDLDNRAMQKFVKLNIELNVLSAANCPRSIDDNVAEEIIKYLQKSLVTLDLSYGTLTENILAKFSLCSKLQSLHLSGCPVTDDVIAVYAQFLPNLERLEVFCSKISNLGVQSLFPGDAGAGLSYLGLTGCKYVEEEYLQRIEHHFKFSVLECSEIFVGFKPRRSELELRKSAQLRYDQQLGSILIQRYARGMLVRIGEYKRRREEWAVNNGFLKLQAIYRGIKSRDETAELLLQRMEFEAATIIASHFKRYHAKTMFDNYLALKRKNQQMKSASTAIQRSYRSFQAKMTLLALKNEVIQRQLKESKERKMKIMASINIQKMVRMFLARTTLMCLKEKKHSHLMRIAQERSSAMAVQRVFRGFQGRRRATEQRIHLRRVEEEWFCARHIQSIWRGFQARRQFQQIVHMRELKAKKHMIKCVQRVWRGYVARRYFKFIKGLRDLHQEEEHASVIIQKHFRGSLGRKTVKFEYERIRRQNVEIKSTKVIQKLYRGYKGREEAEIKLGLEGIKDQTTSLVRSIDDMEANLERERSKRKLSNEEIVQRKIQLGLLEKELETVNDNTLLFIDSAMINGVPQRCAKEIILAELKSKILEERHEIDDLHARCSNITALEHESAKELNRLRKKLSLLVSSTTDKIKTARLKRIRDTIISQ